MATGKTGASPRIFNLRALALPTHAVGLFWEYVPIRKNKYLPNPWARLVFGGFALGVRCCGRGRDNAAAAALGALAGPRLDTGGEGQRNDLEARGKS